MRRLRRITAYMMIIAAAVCAIRVETPRQAYAATTQDQLDEAREAYEDTKDKIDEANDSLSNLTQEQEALKETLDDLNGKLEDAGVILESLERSINDKKTEIDATWGVIEELAARISELELEADEKYELAKAQIKYAYESGDVLYMAILRGAGSYADYINRGSYFEMFVEYNQNSIDDLIATSKVLKETRAEYELELIELEEEQETLADYEETVQKQHDEIQVMVDDTSERVAKYSDDIEETERLLKEYEARLIAQEDNIETLQAKLEEERKISAQASASEWRDISTVSYAEGDRKLLANLIWCEAGNEPYVGQVAVGAVVMNRVMSSVFPDTIVGVIYQRKQFTPASSGRLALALSVDSADESCYKAADAAMSGVNNIGSCLYFRTPTSAVTPKYTIGGHYFY